VFSARNGYSLDVDPVPDEVDWRYAPMVWLPTGVMLTGPAEKTRHLIPQDAPAAGDDYPGVTRAVAAMAELVRIVNEVVADALAAGAVK
jgi:hypothetical protein